MSGSLARRFGLIAKLPQFSADAVRSPRNAIKRMIRFVAARARSQGFVRNASNQLYDRLPRQLRDKIRRLVLQPIEPRPTTILTVDDLTERGRQVYGELQRRLQRAEAP